MKLKKFMTLLIFCIFSFTLIAKEFSDEDAKNYRKAVVVKAKSYIGSPYKLGAVGPDAFDCSGLAYSVYKDIVKLQLPRSSKAIYSAATIVPFSEIQEGDIVFFKTNGSSNINHLGIYIGRNQFIHAASDGANTGVIASSLTEKYYKNAYAATGKFITTKKKSQILKQESQEALNQNENNSDNKTSQKTSKNTTTSQSSGSSSSLASYSSQEDSSSSFLSNLDFEAMIFYDWNLWTTNFEFNYRGVNFVTLARYSQYNFKPAIGTGFRWNHGTQIFQIPLYINLGFNDYFEFYFGPVFSFSHGVVPNTSTEIKGLVFPGIIGVSFNTPKIQIGKVKCNFTQDVCFTIYTRENGNALGFGNAMNAGLVFSTGIRVTLPYKMFLK